MRIEDTDAARQTSDRLEQAAHNIIEVIKDTSTYPNIAVYHGHTFDFQGYTFEFDPQGWLLNIAGGEEHSTGLQASGDGWEMRKKRFLEEGHSA